MPLLLGRVHSVPHNLSVQDILLRTQRLLVLRSPFANMWPSSFLCHTAMCLATVGVLAMSYVTALPNWHAPYPIPLLIDAFLHGRQNLRHTRFLPGLGQQYQDSQICRACFVLKSKWISHSATGKHRLPRQGTAL